MRLGAIIVLGCVALGGAARAGSTRCWIDQGAVVVAAAFGDIAGDFIVDAGATESSLHVTRANEAGIVADDATATLRVAGQRVPSLRIKVADLDGLAQTDTSIAGVIGEDVLARYEVTILFAPCRLILERTARHSGDRGLPVRLIDGAPSVSVLVSDGVVARLDWMSISTRRSESLVGAATLTRELKPGSITPVRLRALEVYGRLFEQVPAGLAVTGHGSIGTDVWRGWRSMRLDARQGRLVLN